MNLFSMNGVSKAYTDKVLLDSATFGIESGDRIGVIGVNGMGKSTLLKIIAGVEDADGGDIVYASNVVISYLPQTPGFDRNYTLYEYVVTENVKKRKPADGFEAKELEAELEGEAKKILSKLGFNDITQKVETLSGGQKKKAALAAALLSGSDILLLDEPTNHLDNAMTEWLQDFLSSYRGALVMVTHDRYFLDLVCDRIVEVDRGHLYTYDTNYEGFLNKKAERQAMALSTQDKHRNILRKEIAWMKRGARARSTKQKAHIRRYEALRDEAAVELDTSVEINAISSRLGKKTIELIDVCKGYGDRTLIRDFSYNFLRDERVGVLGPNGCGKTTLMKIIAGALEPDAGSVERGETVVIGYFTQEAGEMDDNERVIDCVRDTADYIATADGTITAAQMCEKFLFDGTLQHQLIGKLSGGEKRRLSLCKVLMQAPNVLILDEPTNDLDIATLQILEDYLDSFPGIVIAVSHDRYFLDRTMKHMLVFDGAGGISLYNGTYTEFFMEHEEGLDGSISVAGAAGGGKAAGTGKSSGGENGSAAKAAGGKRSASEQNGDCSSDGQQDDGAADRVKEGKNAGRGHALKFTYKEQKEYETIEDDIASCEDEISRLEDAINANARDFVKLAELTRQKEEAEAKLESLMERYVYLADKAEAIRNA